MELRITWTGKAQFERFEEAAEILGSAKLREVENRAVNRTGDMARTQVYRSLAKQTGLKRGVIVRAVRTTRSDPGSLAYTMRAQGGDIALKYFGPRETRAGVSAAPFGRRRVFAGTFLKGGRFPMRKAIAAFKGNVMFRTGPARFPVDVEQSGVIIPNEMVKGATKAAFEATVAKVLPQRIAHEIKRATKGVVS